MSTLRYLSRLPSVRNGQADVTKMTVTKMHASFSSAESTGSGKSTQFLEEPERAGKTGFVLNSGIRVFFSCQGFFPY